jgi:hypothetical protein
MGKNSNVETKGTCIVDLMVISCLLTCRERELLFVLHILSFEFENAVISSTVFVDFVSFYLFFVDSWV